MYIPELNGRSGLHHIHLPVGHILPTVELQLKYNINLILEILQCWANSNPQYTNQLLTQSTQPYSTSCYYFSNKMLQDAIHTLRILNH